MAEKQSVIHKQVISLSTAMFLNEQIFQVPIDAEMCELAWDTRDEHGIAFWYVTEKTADDIPGQEVKFWTFLIRGTGQAYPSKATHLATVVKDGYAWHVLDADGKNINWAEM